MVKWLRNEREARKARLSHSPPPTNPRVALPDPEEARQALDRSMETRKHTEDLTDEVHEWLHFIRSARATNGFAEGIVRLIEDGLREREHRNDKGGEVMG